MRIQGCKDRRIEGYKDTSIQGYKNRRIIQDNRMVGKMLHGWINTVNCVR